MKLKRLLALMVINTVLFTFATMIDVAIWKVLFAEIVAYIIYVLWQSWFSPTQQLVKQGSHMGWKYLGVTRDENGYRDTVLQRNGTVVRISYQKKSLTIVEPRTAGPFDNFVELERYLTLHQPDEGAPFASPRTN